MPELPEVQTIVDDLNKKIIGRKIIGVWSDWSKLVKKPSFLVFKKIIEGKKILSVSRRAKNILIYLSDDLLLLIHQKMTGHLLVGKWNVEKRQGEEVVVPIEPESVVSDPYNRFIHVIFYLDNGQMAALSDMRKFAKIILGSKKGIQESNDLKMLGLEPLDKKFNYEKFASLLKNDKRKIKQVLMDQKIISGIGNIYSDEILWSAKINPFKPADKILDKKLKDLFKAIKNILTKAIKLRGISVSDFRDTAGKKGYYGDKRSVYRREGEKCPRCGEIIVRKKIGGRSAHYCPKCQRPE